MKKTPRRHSPSRTANPETPPKAKCVTVRLMPDLLRKIDAAAAGEYLTREAYIRRAAAAACGGTDTRATLARGLFSPVMPIARSTTPKASNSKRPKPGTKGRTRRKSPR